MDATCRAIGRRLAVTQVTLSRRLSLVVVKFNDYQCPACAQTHLVYDPIFAKYESSHPGSVRLVTRDFPLDPDCNAATQEGPHDAACDAALGHVGEGWHVIEVDPV